MILTGHFQSDQKIETGSVVKPLSKMEDRIEMSESSLDSLSWRRVESSGQVPATTT